MKQLLKAPLQAKHKSPYILLIDKKDQQPYTITVDTMKNGPYYKTPNTESCSAQCQLLSLMVQCAKCSWQHTVWSGWCTQIGRLICELVDSWTHGLVDSWIVELWILWFVDSWVCGFVDLWIHGSVDSWTCGLWICGSVIL